MGRKRTGVTARSQTSIEITFQYRGRRCRETLNIKPSPSNLTRAERHRAAILLAIENGTFDYATTFPNSKNRFNFVETPSEVIKVEQYLEEWLENKIKELKASTVDGYKKIINYQIIPVFGQLTLSELKRKEIKDWLKTLDCGNKRLANIQSVLRKALADAVEDEILTDNPLFNWSYKNKEAPPSRDIIDPFTPEEQESIIKNCPEPMANQILFAFWTGIRPSELVALTWDDIDWHRNEIIIDKAITQAGKGKVESTKTTSGIRHIKMLNPAKNALLSQKKYTYLKGDRIFIHPITLKPWTGSRPIRRYWVDLLKRSKVRYRRPYQTRHTYASMMLSAGEHPMWVAQQMGHSNWAMIIRVYGKWMPSADEGAGSKAEEKFASKVVAKVVANQP